MARRKLSDNPIEIKVYSTKSGSLAKSIIRKIGDRMIVTYDIITETILM